MTTFQRCTNRSMGDRRFREQILQQQQQQDESDSTMDPYHHNNERQQQQLSSSLPQSQPIVFGASDEIGATTRQIRGAAVVGGVAGAALAGPCTAIAVAAVSAYAAAKRECEIGEATRVVGDTVADTSEFLLTNTTLNRTMDEYSTTRRRRRTTTRNNNDINNNSTATTTNTNTNKAMRKRDIIALKTRTMVRGCSERVSQVKDRVSSSVQRKIRRRKQEIDDGMTIKDDDNITNDDTEFEDCLTEEDFFVSNGDDSDDSDDDEEDFKDAISDVQQHRLVAD